jgi:glutaredoxin
LLSDFYPHGRVAQLYGLLRKEGYSERAIFVVDTKGVIRYVDVHDIDEQPDNEELFRVLAEISPQLQAPIAQVQRPADQAAAYLEPEDEVVMYCTSWCPACGRARAYFNNHGIKFTEVNITRNRAAATRVREWTGGYETTPTFKIRGKVIIDFRKDEIAKLLEIDDF